MGTPCFLVMQLTKELEAGKARVEDEMIATVHIATGLEARLRQAKLDADLAQQQAQQADQRANQVFYCASPSCMITFCSSAFVVCSLAPSQLRMLQCCKVGDSCLPVFDCCACKQSRQIVAAAGRLYCMEPLRGALLNVTCPEVIMDMLQLGSAFVYKGVLVAISPSLFEKEKTTPIGGQYREA